MMTRMTKMVLGTLILILSLHSSWAAPPAAKGPNRELAERMMERRAVEAVLWGMPAVNFQLML
ncbi:hypothetical protein R0K04_24310, partial [Pseudoalteromonas sp. SIMBA_153]